MKAFITGGRGQDAWYLAEALRAEGYEYLLSNVDVTRRDLIADAVRAERPDEVYNLAAVAHTDDLPRCLAVNAIGAANVLDAATRCGARFLQAGSVAMFAPSRLPQHEASPLRPASAYAIAKAAAFWATAAMRRAGGFACNAILTNHESLRRKEAMVLQKIARGVAAIVAGEQKTLELGCLDARRDWLDPADVARALVAILRADAPGDYVVARGERYTVRHACRVAFAAAGLNWREYVRGKDTPPDALSAVQADPLRLRQLGWKPEVEFEDMVAALVTAALEERKAAA